MLEQKQISPRRRGDAEKSREDKTFETQRNGGSGGIWKIGTPLMSTINSWCFEVMKDTTLDGFRRSRQEAIGFRTRPHHKEIRPRRVRKVFVFTYHLK